MFFFLLITLNLKCDDPNIELGANGRCCDRRTRNGNVPIEYCRRSCSCEFSNDHGSDDQIRGVNQQHPSPQLLSSQSPSQPKSQRSSTLRIGDRDCGLRCNRKQLEQHQQQFRGRNNHEQQQRIKLTGNGDSIRAGTSRQQQFVQPPEFTSALSSWWNTGSTNRERRGKQWFAFIGNSHGTLPPSSNNEQQETRRCRPVRPPIYPPHSSQQRQWHAATNA